MAVVQADIDAINARLDDIEAALGNVPAVPPSDTALADIIALQNHTISRAQIDAITTLLERQVAQAEGAANAATNSILEMQVVLNGIKVALNSVLEGVVSNEAVTGAIDGANRDFVTDGATPYQPGSLIAVVDNKVYYGTDFITETDPTVGEFKLLITPQASQIVKAMFYLKGNA